MLIAYRWRWIQTTQHVGLLWASFWRLLVGIFPQTWRLGWPVILCQFVVYTAPSPGWHCPNNEPARNITDCICLRSTDDGRGHVTWPGPLSFRGCSRDSSSTVRGLTWRSSSLVERWANNTTCSMKFYAPGLWRVCLSVCMSVLLHISETARPNFAKLLWRDQIFLIPELGTKFQIEKLLFFGDTLA